MLFVGTSIIHPSTEGVFLLCNILDLLIYSYESEFTKEVQNMKKIRGLRSSGRAGTAAARVAPELVEPILE